MNKIMLGEILEITSSKRIHAEDYVECGIPFYRSKEVIQLGRGERITEVLHISNEQYSEIKSKFPVPAIGDILLTSVGTIGIPYFVTNANFYFKDGNLTWFRNFSKSINSKYLLFWMQSSFFKNQINNNNIGAVQKALTIDFLKKFVIRIPPLDTQQKIVSVLSALDSKIELNNRINAELEAIAKTLYDYWFVQFDFPNKKGKPYKASGGKMVWSDELKREIPEGWDVVKMSEWINIDKSGDWGKEEPEGNFTKKVTCIRGADINGLNGLDELKPPVRFILEKNSFKVLKSHDIVIEISGGSPTQSTGRLAFITDATINRFENPLICSNFCKPISLKNEKLLYNFVYYWNSLYDNGVFFGYEGKTSGIKNLLLDSFVNSFYTVVPDQNIVNKFYDMMENIQKKKQTALAENQKLTELRDWLLPMLMNGQIKIKDAERLSSEALTKDEESSFAIGTEDKLAMAAEPETNYRKKK
jgi:type I restriction enzyme S subunit